MVEMFVELDRATAAREHLAEPGFFDRSVDCEPT
jgi:hypothetical protein